jgi:hypothetical protein
MRILLTLIAMAEAVLTFPHAAEAAASAKPDRQAPQFDASVEDRREEQDLAECDERADARKLANYDRFKFIERCLQARREQSNDR